MEEQPTDLAALLPGIAGQMRGLLSNLYLAAAQAIPAERREQDAVLDSKAAVLEQSFYRLLRMVNGISATEYLSEKSTLVPAGHGHRAVSERGVRGVRRFGGDAGDSAALCLRHGAVHLRRRCPPLWNRRSYQLLPTR